MPPNRGASRQATANRRAATHWAGRRGASLRARRAGGAACPECAGRRLRRSVLRTDSPPLLATGSCGATRCARCASSAQTGRRKSEVRSALRAPTPRLRCSAPQTSAHCGHGPPSARALPCRTASRRDSAGPLPPCRSASVGDLRRTGRASTSSATATPPAKARAIGRRCALCAAEKRSSTGGARSAHRPSFSRRLSERSSRSERSEFRRASRCCEHRRAPPRSGGKHPARPRPTGQAPGQPLGPGLPKRSANAVAGAFAHATLPRS